MYKIPAGNKTKSTAKPFFIKGGEHYKKTTVNETFPLRVMLAIVMVEAIRWRK